MVLLGKARLGWSLAPAQTSGAGGVLRPVGLQSPLWGARGGDSRGPTISQVSPLGQGVMGGRGREGPPALFSPWSLPARDPGPGWGVSPGLSFPRLCVPGHLPTGHVRTRARGDPGVLVPAAQLLWFQHAVRTDHLRAQEQPVSLGQHHHQQLLQGTQGRARPGVCQAAWGSGGRWQAGPLGAAPSTCGSAT